MLASCFCGASLTWLPWLSTEAAGGHIRRSGVTAAAPHGETEVTALPETQQQIVRSLPVSTSTSCSKSFICSRLVSVDHSYNCNSQLLFCYQTLLIGLIPGLNSNKLYLNNFASWFDLNRVIFSVSALNELIVQVSWLSRAVVMLWGILGKNPGVMWARGGGGSFIFYTKCSETNNNNEKSHFKTCPIILKIIINDVR